MRSVIIISIFLTSFFCRAQNEVIGFIHLHISSNLGDYCENNFGFTYGENGDPKMVNDHNDTLEIQFIRNINEKDTYSRKLTFVFDSVEYQNVLINDPNWMSIDCFTHDTTFHGYFYYNFKCLQKKGDYYQIMINEKTKETAWLKNSKYTEFISFQKDITKTSFFMTFRLDKSNAIKVYKRKNPNSSSEYVKPINLSCYKIVKRRGDWVKIKITKHTSCTNPFSPSGWVKLFDQGKLLIDIKCR